MVGLDIKHDRAFKRVFLSHVFLHFLVCIFLFSMTHVFNEFFIFLINYFVLFIDVFKCDLFFSSKNLKLIYGF